MTSPVLIFAGWADRAAAETYAHQIASQSEAMAHASGDFVADTPPLETMSNTTAALSEAARRKLQIQHDQAVAHWGQLIPPRDGHGGEDTVGRLSAAYDGHPAGSFVFSRRFDDGALYVVAPYLKLVASGQELSPELDVPDLPAPPPPSAPVAPMEAIGIGMDIGSEIGSIASLIGMVAITSNPAVGIPLMIGGQILSFIFREIGKGGGGQHIPSVEEIRAAIKGELQDQYVIELSDEAASLWSLFLEGFENDWSDESNAPNETVYKDFVDWLNNAVVPAHGAKVTSANMKIVLHLGDTENKGGYKSGLHHLPNYLAATGVEVLALQLLVLDAGARSQFGTGDDPQAVADYRAALERGTNRIARIKEGIDAALEEAEAQIKKRLEQLDMTMKPALFQTEHTSSGNYVVVDKGGYPPLGITDDDGLLGSYSITYACCDAMHYGTTEDEARANIPKVAAKYRGKCEIAFGVSDQKSIKAAQDALDVALEDMNKSLTGLNG